MNVFDEAASIVNGDRRQDYGGVRGSFDRIALMWSGVLGYTVTGEQVALCMIGLKLVRESHRHKRDNVVDIAGYTACLERLTEGAPCEAATGSEHVQPTSKGAGK